MKPQPVILHVEDNEAVRYGIGRVLLREGFVLQEAPTGEEGLRRARESPDLILLDVKLPDMSGFDVCKLLKSDPETFSIPVLHLTSTYGSSEHLAAGLEGGADGYLTHPVEPIVLVATIRALLRARVAERQVQELLRLEAAARAAAEQANRLKDEFLATLSHELRTPLNAILGWVQLLRSGSMDTAGVARAVETIERNAKAQAQLIADILEVSRIITGKLRLDVHPLDLRSVVRSAAETVRPGAEAKGVALDLSLDRDVPPVSGDPDRLQQVVWNLLSNAIKFTPRGGRVEAAVEASGSHVQITVRDTGQGIAPAFLPHVFDRFRQADASTARLHGGLGLGLAIVRHLVELHGGAVGAESQGEGRGATFIVRLPVLGVFSPAVPAAVGTAREALLEPEASLPAPPRSSLLGLRVLVVDDHPDTLELVSTVLRGHGAEVAAASSTAEAKRVFGDVRPHVLLSDIGMPEQDGYELIRYVRGLPEDRGGATPAAALTAYASPADRLKILDAGFQAHIPKPVEPLDLVTLVVRLVGAR
ncbi:MAG TPA: response regulator [Thermoanaerobaculia bacterium]|nr:response regulator [Thermoanaerobaculia bacterium]